MQRQYTHVLARRRNGLPQQRVADLAGEFGEELLRERPAQGVFADRRPWVSAGMSSIARLE